MQIPKHIAIIMDGNGRWAKERGVPTIKGHRAGIEALRRTVKAALGLGIKYLTLYAFSVDNWNRSKKEVDSLMDLMREFLNKEVRDLEDKDVHLIVIGRTQGLPKDIVNKIEKIAEKTAANQKLNLVIALNYGGRTEIVDAVKKLSKDLLENKLALDNVDEKLFSKYLYTKDIPDPDLFIRTSGEMRLSNFLLWQLSYTELWVTSVYWPDFSKEHLVQAIGDFNNRKRTFGGRPNAR